MLPRSTARLPRPVRARPKGAVMTTNPIHDLLDDYGVRRERAVKSTAGPYQDDRKAVIGAADAMIERVHKARETLSAIDADLQRGVISQDQAPRLRRAVL